MHPEPCRRWPLNTRVGVALFWNHVAASPGGSAPTTRRQNCSVKTSGPAGRLRGYESYAGGMIKTRDWTQQRIGAAVERCADAEEDDARMCI